MFLILRNHEYSSLRWFASLENVTGAPALDLPGLDVAATALSYGVPSQSVSGREELHEAITEALAQPDPRLVQVDVPPGMALVGRRGSLPIQWGGAPARARKPRIMLSRCDGPPLLYRERRPPSFL